MWEDHMPDFVLDALNQCLPRKEQEETVLYGPPLPSPNTLLVPGSDAVGKNHVHNHIGSRLPRSSANEPKTTRDEQLVLERVASADSLALEVGHPLWRVTALVSEARKAPIARPESAFDDSDLDEGAPSSRVSANWKDFTLPSFEQSTDDVIVETHPVPRSNTDLSDSPLSLQSLKTLDEINRKCTSATSVSHSFDYTPPRTNRSPPPKPPRTFETEKSEGRQSFRYKPPPKPPRTFEYDSQIQVNFSSSLYWNFPRPRARRYETQFSSPDLESSNVSTEHLNGAESETPLAPYSSHRPKMPQFNSMPRTGQEETHMENGYSLGDDDTVALFTKQPSSQNGVAVRRSKLHSDESSTPESRFSVSDSVLNISQEELFLLGSVKPRGGRRKRNGLLKQAASETLHSTHPNLNGVNQPLRSPRRDPNFLETML